MANFNGTLFSMGGVKFPLTYIYKESYESTVHVQDLDSTVTTQGVLQRNVLDKRRYTVKYTTKPMYIEDYTAMWNFIRGHWQSASRREAQITFYDEETDSYLTDVFYLAEFTHKKDLVDETNRNILYLSQTHEWISLGNLT